MLKRIQPKQQQQQRTSKQKMPHQIVKNKDAGNNLFKEYSYKSNQKKKMILGYKQFTI